MASPKVLINTALSSP